MTKYCKEENCKTRPIFNLPNENGYNPDNKEHTTGAKHKKLISTLKYYLDYSNKLNESIKLEYL
jgi:hypothetical protein